MKPTEKKILALFIVGVILFQVVWWSGLFTSSESKEKLASPPQPIHTKPEPIHHKKPETQDETTKILPPPPSAVPPVASPPTTTTVPSVPPTTTPATPPPSPPPKKELSMKEVLKILSQNTKTNKHIVHGVPYIITATSADYFDRLENFVGSIHRLYETKDKTYKLNSEMVGDKDETIKNRANQLLSKTKPTTTYWMAWNSMLSEEARPIIAYNLGLRPEQIEKVKTWKNVELVDIDFSILPAHFSDLKTFAWKPLVMYLALERYPSIIFLDSGVELWNRLDRIEKLLVEKGHFHVVQEGLHTAWKCCGNVGELTHDGTFKYLGLSREELGSKVMCSGGIQGYIRNSVSYQKVLIPTLECAWNSECIVPQGSSLANHRQDQSVFSMFIHKAGITCETDPRLWGNPNNREGVPDSEVVIYLRKGDGNKPFISSVVQNKRFAIVVPYIAQQSKAVLDNIDSWNTYKYMACYKNDDYMTTDLIFYLNRDKNEKIETETLEKISKSPIASCFDRIYFKYANLTDKEDVYPAGASYQFYKLFDFEDFYTTYDHFFYMEPDCRAIRANWVNELQTIVRENLAQKPGFWYIGSMFRGDMPLDPIYRLHINGNAIYSTHVSLRALLSKVHQHYTQTFDADAFMFLFEPHIFDITKQIFPRVIYHDFVQNWYHSAWNEEALRILSPRTYFIHGGDKYENDK